ncbi:UNVERIFIED_ORG: hypothetical protein DFS12_104263 [Chitinophaga ginsengisegetis]|nr:hypothetical protein [Chitinophaga ginsengisegetis]MDR6648204.1 hypothetical protein [Chitinophaga ginsengisegetis]MDR6654646.1 hypothetical protein [Chitinophaga ginsengisegetis]
MIKIIKNLRKRDYFIFTINIQKYNNLLTKPAGIHKT